MPRSDLPQPPASPDVDRSLSFHRLQLIGVPVLLLVPLLAVFGVFGPTEARSRHVVDGLTIEVEHPSRMRFKTVSSIEIVVSNESADAIEDVEVAIDSRYLDGFSSVTFVPEVRLLTEETASVAVGSVPAGGSRRVSIEVQAQRYGNHQGVVRVSAGGVTRQLLPIATFTYP